MLKVILVFVGLGVLAAVGAALLNEGIVKQLLQFGAATDALILVFLVSIALLQWLAPANPDGTPRT